MDSDIKKDDFIRRFQRFLEEDNLSHQKSRVQWATMIRLFLDYIKSNIDCDTCKIPIPAEQMVIAYANGHHLSEEDFSNLNEEDYDVVLNVVEGILKFRRNPNKKRSRLEMSPLHDFGRARFGFLAACLRRPPGRLITVDSMPALPNESEPRGPDTLRKTISVVRKAIGGSGRYNPYILNDRFRPGYILNPYYRYLLIMEEK